MTSPDPVFCAQLSRTHARAFSGVARGWSGDEFADLLLSPLVTLIGDGLCFAVIRVVLDEAELLTIATDPHRHRQGRGRRCLAQTIAKAADRGAARLFLEVGADNAPAIAMYHAAGFAQSGRRADYYRRTATGPVDALLMDLTLR